MLPHSTPRTGCTRTTVRRASFLAVAHAALLLPVASSLPPSLLAPTGILVLASLWLGLVDLATFRIPDAASLAILVAGLAAAVLSAPSEGGAMALVLLAHLAAGMVGLVLLWALGGAIFRRTGRDALGLGDAKLLGAGGVWVGPAGLPSVLLLASLSALGVLLLSGQARRRAPIAFGPYLSLAVLAVWLYGPVTLWGA